MQVKIDTRPLWVFVDEKLKVHEVGEGEEIPERTTAFRLSPPPHEVKFLPVMAESRANPSHALAQVFRSCVVDWSGVLDHTGEALEFRREYLQALDPALSIAVANFCMRRFFKGMFVDAEGKDARGSGDSQNGSGNSGNDTRGPATATRATTSDEREDSNRSDTSSPTNAESADSSGTGGATHSPAEPNEHGSHSTA